jgi:hypothetical protein
MLRRQKKVVSLQEELTTLALLDRGLDYTPDSGPTDNLAYASRQIRRSQIEAEMRKSALSKPHTNHTRIGSAALLLCAVGYLTLHYLLR